MNTAKGREKISNSKMVSSTKKTFLGKVPEAMDATL
jgi:hypothetical protein